MSINLPSPYICIRSNVNQTAKSICLYKVQTKLSMPFCCLWPSVNQAAKALFQSLAQCQSYCQCPISGNGFNVMFVGDSDSFAILIAFCRGLPSKWALYIVFVRKLICLLLTKACAEGMSRSTYIRLLGV